MTKRNDALSIISSKTKYLHISADIVEVIASSGTLMFISLRYYFQ